MHVHTVRVSFLREKQPKDCEKSAPSIEFSASLNESPAEGEDHVAAGRRLMRDAAAIVYNALGLEVPAPVSKKLDGSAEPAAKAKKAEPKPKADAKAESRRQISETPEDRKAPDDDLPSDMAIPEEPEAKAETVAAVPVPTTPVELHGEITVLVTQKKLTVPAIKEILSSFGVGRTSDLPADKIPEVWKAIQDAVGA